MSQALERPPTPLFDGFDEDDNVEEDLAAEESNVPSDPASSDDPMQQVTESSDESSNRLIANDAAGQQVGRYLDKTRFNPKPGIALGHYKAVPTDPILSTSVLTATDTDVDKDVQVREQRTTARSSTGHDELAARPKIESEYAAAHESLSDSAWATARPDEAYHRLELSWEDIARMTSSMHHDLGSTPGPIPVTFRFCIAAIVWIALCWVAAEFVMDGGLVWDAVSVQGIMMLGHTTNTSLPSFPSRSLPPPSTSTVTLATSAMLLGSAQQIFSSSSCARLNLTSSLPSSSAASALPLINALFSAAQQDANHGVLRKFGNVDALADQLVDLMGKLMLQDGDDGNRGRSEGGNRRESKACDSKISGREQCFGAILDALDVIQRSEMLEEGSCIAGTSCDGWRMAD